MASGEPDFGVALREEHIPLLNKKWLKDSVPVPGGPVLEFTARNLGYPFYLP